MTTANVLLLIGIVAVAFLIRKEIRHGIALDKQAKDDAKESSQSMA